MKSNKVRFLRRKQRVRSKISSVSDRKRLVVFKSGKHIYAQIIDDSLSCTLVAASTLDKEIRQKGKSNCNKVFAAKVGQLLASRAAEKQIHEVVFDKGGHAYHGVIEVLANEARKVLSF
jgi:large subunit ribosomal protein L18